MSPVAGMRTHPVELPKPVEIWVTEPNSRNARHCQKHRPTHQEQKPYAIWVITIPIPPAQVCVTACAIFDSTVISDGFIISSAGNDWFLEMFECVETGPTLPGDGRANGWNEGVLMRGLTTARQHDSTHGWVSGPAFSRCTHTASLP